MPLARVRFPEHLVEIEIACRPTISPQRNAPALEFDALGAQQFTLPLVTRATRRKGNLAARIHDAMPGHFRGRLFEYRANQTGTTRQTRNGRNLAVGAHATAGNAAYGCKDRSFGRVFRAGHGYALRATGYGLRSDAGSYEVEQQ